PPRCLPPSRLAPTSSSDARRPPRPTLRPYTTLFRSTGGESALDGVDAIGRGMRDRLEHGFADLLIGDIGQVVPPEAGILLLETIDRKSTRLNSSHVSISYAVFCLKKKSDRNRRATME